MKKEEQVMMELWNLFNKRMWLDGFKLKARLKGYNPSEVHCIEYIGGNEDSNVTLLAESFYMTRSAISKLTKKLIQKGLIESYRKPDNKKEIYFRLTGQGNDIYKVHGELHKEYRERDKALFDQITEEQYDSMLSFTEKYNKHLDAEIKKLGVDITSGWCDKL
ncbi:MarR family transcriptional regulator [Clostridium botulinum A2 117]|uniref:MarR family transcriptional regulator n=1 Tax=Clostridium botulinum TaxID=1491 RepID=UPI0007E2A598|nr:MarR family transcriptional regulator [Clostridium botulinum]KEI77735.1 MarR family transcriptional regulator [Clostridium botulinum A2 117]MBN3414903.1 MarR family transcriptional regulator [Clostridium botulinum]MBN3441196.1 MarR family transcriptional regulator [Clostridium botulinum]MBY6805265.1 MarR family transcriptional regulator [Clostridium botulinum]